MVSKKLTARLEKKQQELQLAKDKVKDLELEVNDLNIQVRAELMATLQERLKTDDLSILEQFINGVSPVAETNVTTEDALEETPHTPNDNENDGFDFGGY